MRVGERKTGHPALDTGAETEHEPAPPADAGRLAEEARAQHDIGARGPLQRQHRLEVFGPMLTVGIEGGDVVRPFTKGEVDTGLERRALAKVEMMPDDRRAGGKSDITGTVGRAVVDQHNILEMLHQLGNDFADDRTFIEGRNNDPDRWLLPVAHAVTGQTSTRPAPFCSEAPLAAR